MTSGMKDFKQALYEALLVAFGKTLAKHNAFAQAATLSEVGRELIAYLNRQGLGFEETGTPEDLATLTNLFVQNGFAEKLDILPADPGHLYVWHNLYGREAYQELHEVSDNPFLACPLNLCLYYLAAKHRLSLRLISKSFEGEGGVVQSHYELVEQAPLEPSQLDPLVIENARLYELARAHAASLEAEMAERARVQEQLQAQNQALEREIDERNRAQQELDHVHRRLMEASHRAGQAEIAGSVLHNIGNVLNSVNVSTTLLSDRLRTMRLAHLARATRLLAEHAADLPHFLTTDDRGRRLPAFLAELSQHLCQEQTELLVEMGELERSIDRIKVIVAAQKTYTQADALQEPASLVEIVNESIQVHLSAFEHNAVQIVRDVAAVPAARLSRYRLTQILVTLLNNARQACDDSPGADRQMVLRVRMDHPESVMLEVSDNGVGIAPEHLARIFAPGFTTRSTGHGFALHSAALAAAEMGGSLTARSAGRGQGASFVLRLPLQRMER